MSERKHDLPPTWDGHAIEWQGWTASAAVACARFPRGSCPRCGHGTAGQRVNIGVIYTLPPSGVQSIWAGRRVTGSRRIAGNLVAFRCTYCGLDQVIDAANRLWDLTEADYTDEGSWLDA